MGTLFPSSCLGFFLAPAGPFSRMGGKGGLVAFILRSFFGCEKQGTQMDWREELRKEVEDVTQSPIEAMLLSCILILWGLERIDNNGSTPFLAEKIVPQYLEGNFKIDIAIIVDKYIKLAIECDGHEFHEKTKEQAAHDKSRKRYLTSKGWAVIEFTGSEIHKNPFDCARQVRDLTFDLHYKYWVMSQRASR